MKPSIEFENIAQDLFEKRKMKQFITLDQATETNKPLWHLLFLVAVGAIFGIAISCAVVLNWPYLREAAYHTAIYLDSIPTGYQTAIAAFLLIVCIVSWRIVKSAKSSRNGAK